jgi:hypothetical protein
VWTAPSLACAQPTSSKLTELIITEGDDCTVQRHDSTVVAACGHVRHARRECMATSDFRTATAAARR